MKIDGRLTEDFLKIGRRPDSVRVSPDGGTATSGEVRAVTTTRVLVVEDDPAVQDLLVAMLEADGYEVQAVSDGLVALAVARQFRPDLVLIDGHLPGLGGREVARRLDAGTAIAMVTGADRPEDEIAGLQAGADLYITKPFDSDVLSYRLRALLRRVVTKSPQQWRAGDLLFDERAGTVTRAGRPVELTPKETAILSVLVRHRGNVVSKGQLLSEVWGHEGEPTNVVEVHMSSLRRKLHAGGPPIIHTVRSRGYVLRSP